MSIFVELWKLNIGGWRWYNGCIIHSIREKIMEKQYRMALLIDAENVSKKYIKLIMDEITEYGVITYKRVYGDFTNPSVSSWKNSLIDFAMTPVFQFNYTKGKNASDSVMVIDAMDILYSGKVDGFCLVTSDSDFTKLAIRLREAGMLVVGMGEQKTPASLVSACQTFKYLDLLYKEADKSVSENDVKAEKDEKSSDTDLEENIEKIEETDEFSNQNGIPSIEVIESELIAIITARTDGEEWVNLATIGNSIAKRVPGFDPRNYGYKKLKDFIEVFDSFEVQELPNPKNNLLTVVYIKMK